MRNTKRTQRWPLWAVAVGGLLALSGLAGCIDVIDQDGNQAPTAELTSDKPSAFEGEEFAFDASASADADGNITTYRFDFGDNQSFEVKDPDDPKVEHAYERAGEYVVTMTVIDDGGAEGEERLTDTATLNVAVNENQTIASQVIFAGPANATTGAHYGHEFMTYEGVDRFELNVTVRSVLVAGSSELTIKVVDPENQAIAEDQVSVPAGEEASVLLEGMLSVEGNHTVLVEAESGGASVSGQLVVYYDEGF